MKKDSTVEDNEEAVIMGRHQAPPWMYLLQSENILLVFSISLTQPSIDSPLLWKLMEDSTFPNIEGLLCETLRDTGALHGCIRCVVGP